MMSATDDEGEDTLLRQLLEAHGARIVKSMRLGNRPPIHTVEIHDEAIEAIRAEIPGVTVEPNSSLMFPGNE